MPISRTWTRICLTALSATTALTLLSGCTGESDASAAVREASQAISGIAAGGGAGVEPGVAIEGFTEARRVLDRPLDGTAAEKASVQILKSRAQSGIAAGQGLEINHFEAEAAQQIIALRSLARQWQSLHAQAAAAESYDPGPEIAALASDERDIASLIESAQSSKAAFDARLAELQNQIAGLQAEAKSERDQAAKLELQAATLSAIEAAELAPQIQQYAHAADLKLLDVQRLEARLKQVSTEAREASLNLEKLVEQRNLLFESQADARRAATEAGAQAQAARSQAAGVATKLREAAQSLVDFRTGRGSEGASLLGLYDEQIAALTSAASNARQAESDMRANAKAARASANLSLGDAHAKRARSFAALAELMTSLATLSPALPDGAWFNEQAQKASTEMARSTDAASEAYSAAADDFAALGGRSDSRDMLDAVVARLNAMAGKPAQPQIEDPAEGFDSEQSGDEAGGNMPDDEGFEG